MAIKIKDIPLRNIGFTGLKGDEIVLGRGLEFPVAKLIHRLLFDYKLAKQASTDEKKSILVFEVASAKYDVCAHEYGDWDGYLSEGTFEIGLDLVQMKINLFMKTMPKGKYVVQCYEYDAKQDTKNIQTFDELVDSFIFDENALTKINSGTGDKAWKKTKVPTTWKKKFEEIMKAIKRIGEAEIPESLMGEFEEFIK